MRKIIFNDRYIPNDQKMFRDSWYILVVIHRENYFGFVGYYKYIDENEVQKIIFKEGKVEYYTPE